MSVLTNEEADLLFSLSDLDLERWLRANVADHRDRMAILNQLQTHRTPKERCEDSLHEYVRQAWHLVEPDQDYLDNWHIAELCSYLERIADGEIENFLANIPPGCMKSLLCAVFFPTWIWGPRGQPGTRWLFASYSQSLSTRDSKKRRDIIESKWYQAQWPVTLAGDQNLKTRFDNTARGSMYATSVGGAGTGEHPDYIIVDDPLNAEEAASEADRERVIRWWDGTISTRGRVRGVKRLVIMQRLHEEDLSGHLLKKGGFVHFCLPMRYEKERVSQIPDDPRTEEGELLWPAAFSAETVNEIIADLGGIEASAGQMQQRPQDLRGGLFKVDWFRYVTELPPHFVQYVRAWDKAGTEAGGAYTVGVLMTKTADNKFYVLDVIRQQLEYGEREKLILATAESDRQYGHVEIWIEQEPGSGGKQSAQQTINMLVGYSAFTEKVTGDKVTRAKPYSGQMWMGNVFIRSAAWNQDYRDELINFPNGKYADQVDASALAFNKLAQGGVARIHGSLAYDLDVPPAEPEGETEAERFARERREEFAAIARRMDEEYDNDSIVDGW